jgi:hypothetical protein
MGVALLFTQRINITARRFLNSWGTIADEGKLKALSQQAAVREAGEVGLLLSVLSRAVSQTGITAINCLNWDCALELRTGQQTNDRESCYKTGDDKM